MHGPAPFIVVCAIVLLNEGIVLYKETSEKAKIHSDSFVTKIHPPSTLQYDFTIVSVFTASRASFIQEFSKRWKGALLFVFYCDVEDRSILSALRRMIPSNGRIRIIPFQGSRRDEFPINRLRNIGIRQVRTSHYAVVDMDLWPSSTLYDELHTIDSSLLSDGLSAFIIPIFFFNTTRIKGTDPITIGRELYPSSLASLHDCVNSGDCLMRKPNRYTHLLVNEHWFSLNRTTPVAQLRCIPNYEQEPYYFLKRGNRTPLYDERFVGYGYNKMQHMRHLTYVGYQFFILTNAFAMDMPHNHTSKTYSLKRMKSVYKSFLYDPSWNRRMKQRMKYCSRSEEATRSFYMQ